MVLTLMMLASKAMSVRLVQDEKDDYAKDNVVVLMQCPLV